MEAGRELDALIAQKVFGYTLDYEFADMMFDGAPCVKELRDGNDEWGILPSYSTDIGDAWLVVDHLYQHKISVVVSTLHGWRDKCECMLRLFDRDISADASTAPLAICLSALKAIDDHNQH